MTTPQRDESVLASRLDAIATRWSLVVQTHPDGNAGDAVAARQALVLRYARSIRRYVGGFLKSAEDADELAQDVVVRLMRGDFAGADPNRGRFRDLLKTAIRNMVHNHWDRANRRKSADVDLDSVAGEADPQEALWEAEWRQNVLDHAWAALARLESQNPKGAAHTLLRLRTDFPDDTSEQLAARLGEKTGSPVRADACRQMLRRARVQFAEALVTEVGIGLADPTPARVAAELAAVGLWEYVKDFLPDDWAAKGVLRE
jgi:RNA polymerase sigma factor (sigma-70 family)